MLLDTIEIQKKQYYKEKPFVKQNKTTWKSYEIDSLLRL